MGKMILAIIVILLAVMLNYAGCLNDKTKAPKGAFLCNTPYQV